MCSRLGRHVEVQNVRGGGCLGHQGLGSVPPPILVPGRLVDYW